VLSSGLTNKDGRLLGKCCGVGMPSLLAGWSLIDMERVGEKRRAHWRWVLCEVERMTGEVLSSTYARDQKDGDGCLGLC
jgi:hypothetical protein